MQELRNTFLRYNPVLLAHVALDDKLYDEVIELSKSIQEDFIGEYLLNLIEYFTELNFKTHNENLRKLYKLLKAYNPYNDNVNLYSLFVLFSFNLDNTLYNDVQIVSDYIKEYNVDFHEFKLEFFNYMLNKI